jgi:hypothetical protein
LTGIGGLKGLKPNDLKIVKEEKPWRKRDRRDPLRGMRGEDLVDKTHTNEEAGEEDEEWKLKE